jgi:hypothetical protein
MTVRYRLQRLAGWVCLAFVAMFCLLGYYFGNIRFAPLAGGFAILAAIGLIEQGAEQAESKCHSPASRFGSR